MAALARVRRPVKIGLRQRRGKRHGRARGAHKTCYLLGTFLFHPEKHEEGAKLLRQDVPGEDHRHCLFRFLNRQRARQRLAAPKDLDEAGRRDEGGGS